MRIAALKVLLAIGVISVFTLTSANSWASPLVGGSHQIGAEEKAPVAAPSDDESSSGDEEPSGDESGESSDE